jgi:hypothetical protein
MVSSSAPIISSKFRPIIAPLMRALYILAPEQNTIDVDETTHKQLCFSQFCRLEVGDQGASSVTFWCRLSSWLADGCFLTCV